MVRKLLTKMMAVAAGVIAVSSVGSMAFANNHYDTEAQLYLDEASGISEAYTVGRYKEDDSYGYVKHLWSTDGRDYAVALVASDNDGGTEHYEDFELVYYKVYGKGNEENNNEYYLTNYVKENGYNYAAIKACSDLDIPYWVDFLWSPDSVGGPN